MKPYRVRRVESAIFSERPASSVLSRPVTERIESRKGSNSSGCKAKLPLWYAALSITYLWSCLKLQPCSMNHAAR